MPRQKQVNDMCRTKRLASTIRNLANTSLVILTAIINQSCEYKRERLFPENTHSYYKQGKAWMQIYNLDEEIAAYNKSIALDSKNLNAYKEVSYTLILAKRFDESIENLNHYIESSPNESKVYFWRAIAWAAKKDTKRAIVDVDLAIKLLECCVFAISTK